VSLIDSPLIETERLELRPMTIADLEAFVAMHADPAVVEFMGPADRELATKRLEADAALWARRGHGLCKITHRDDGRFIGRVALKHWPQWNETELGWVLRSQEWGHGYATEAGQACADWGFRNLPIPYLTACIQPHNARSIAVARRLRMKPLRHDVLNAIPCVVYGVERGEWPPPGWAPGSDAAAG
jgi:RimJ/RimL family protein N-acetyltransferase